MRQYLRVTVVDEETDTRLERERLVDSFYWDAIGCSLLSFLCFPFGLGMGLYFLARAQQMRARGLWLPLALNIAGCVLSFGFWPTQVFSR